MTSATPHGALALGTMYWRQLERSTRGVVRAVPSDGGTALRVAGRGPALLAFGRPAVWVRAGAVGCTYPIMGGLLARSAGGTICFEQQAAGTGCTLHIEVAGFDPRLAAGPGRPAWTGLLYLLVQAPLHDWIGRRHAAALGGRVRA